MMKHVEALYAIAKKESRLILGLMSGTSLDGLDVALCEVTGSGTKTRINILQFTTCRYEDAFKEEVRKVFALKTADLEQLCLLNEWIAVTHARLINGCLAAWNIPPASIDLIASHGQTVYHAPKSLHRRVIFGNGTLQIGDGDHLAVHTGIITVSDFRQKQIAAGGEGAPLAAYGDFLLFTDERKSRVLLNIGGIANFTYLPAGNAFSNIRCTDTGPGNTLMDAWVQQHFPGKQFDSDAAIAQQGSVNEVLLAALKDNDFFSLPLPKTTGPELFNMAYVYAALTRSNCSHLGAEDVLATLNLFTATTICDAVSSVIADIPNCEILISGGGIHNPLLMSYIRSRFNGLQVSTTSALQINPDAKEAVLFALLANELVAGDERSFGEGSPGFPATGMGKVSFPG